MLEAINVNKTVVINGQPQKIIKDVSVTVNEGEFLTVTGRSGSGKTTLLHLLSTLTTPTSGAVKYNGINTATLSEKQLNKLRHNYFSLIFQFHHLFPYLTVLENCLLPFMQGLKPVPSDTIKIAEKCLERVGLTTKSNMLPGKLSGGEQQRVAIARSLVKSSHILFADEPTGSLDKTTGTEIMDLLCSLNREGLTIIMVTHEQSYAKQGDRIIVLEDGHIVS